MFTQLVTFILTTLGNVPVLLVYAIVAVWIGVDVAGIPLPMEPVLLFVGALGAAGRSSIVLAIASAMLGSLAFATVAYYLGGRYGKSAITRVGCHVGFTEERADHMEVWLRRRGAVGVLIASVSPVIRTFSGYIMGIAEVPRGIFAVGVLAGSLLYSTLWIVVGRVLGANYRAPLRYVDRLGLYGIVVIAVVIGASIALHRVWGEASRQQVAAHFHRHQQAVAQAAAQATQLGPGGARPASLAGLTTPAAETTLMTQSLATDGGSSPVATAMRAAAPAAPTGLPASRSLAHPVPWPRAAWVILPCLWITGAIMLAAMAGSAHVYATFPEDARQSAWIQHMRGTPFATMINRAGDVQWFLPTGIALALIVCTLLVLRLYVEAAFVVLAAFGTDLFNVVISTLVARPRPHGVHITTLVSTFGSASFPAGDVAHSVGLYGFVFFLCILGIRARPRWRAALITVQLICVYFMLFVGPSSVLEGRHLPSDVAAGYLVGALSLSVAIVLYHVLAPYRARELASWMHNRWHRTIERAS